MKRLLRTLAAFTAVIFLFHILGFPMFGSAEEVDPFYVSEIRIFSGQTSAEAKKACQDAGYNIYAKDLNEGTGKAYVYLGYKLTKDKDDAITDIEMLQMGEGYEERDYSVIAKAAMEKMGVVTSEFGHAASEFASNLKKGSPAAQAAKSVLDLFYIPELDNMPLGSYLASDVYSKDMLEKIFVQSSSGVINVIYTSMTGGVADATGNNWASRVDNSVVMDLELGERTSELDAKYRDFASEIADQVIAFSQNYLEALQNMPEGEKTLADQVNASVNTVNKESKAVENAGADPDDAGYVYIMAYEMLNRYTYDGEIPLGEWLVNAGQENSFSKNAELRVLYPLVEALTRGQLAVMRVCGIPQMALYLENSDGIIEKSEEYISGAKSKIKEYCGAEALSVWEGVDQTIYEQKVAMTSSAIRASSAGKFVDSYVKSGNYSETFTMVLTYIGIVSGAISVVWGLSVIGFSIYVGTFSLSAAAMAAAMVSSGVISALISFVGVALNVLNVVCFVVTIIVLIVWAVWALIDMLTEDDDEEYTEIPTAIYDYRDGNYILYSLAESSSSDPFGADLNGGKNEGKRWNALYYTKSKLRGEPIAADADGNVFTVQYGSSSVPAGYYAVTVFGEVTPANTNANARRDNSGGCFLFYRNGKESVPEEDKGENEEKPVSYISDILVSCRDNETYAKSELTSKGFSVIDMNLTPLNRKYTYLGFKTGADPNSAITDIRILPNGNTDSMQLGEASYTSCGTTAVGDSVYYTLSASAGSPICSIIVTSDRNDAENGMEPVNLFCGGSAFNVNRHWAAPGMDYKYDRETVRQRYIFFEPSVKYTEGEEYLGGIVLVAAQEAKDDPNNLDKYIAELGLKSIDGSDLTKGYVPAANYNEFKREYEYINPIATRICYSTTRNPYRAVYDIASYTGEPNARMVSPVLGSSGANGTYAVCAVYYQGYEWRDASTSAVSANLPKGILESNSYINFNGMDIDHTGSNPEYFEGYTWPQCYIARCKSLFVLGKTAGKSPIKVSDILFSTESTAPAGYVSVQDLRANNSSDANNLAYHFDKYQYKMTISEPSHPELEKSYGSEQYLYVKGSNSKKTYISSISVHAIKDGDEDATNADTCFAYLLASCTDEIKMVNLAAGSDESLNGKQTHYTARCAYVGVSRTDKESAAITGVIKYAPADGKAPDSITVDGISYKRAGTSESSSAIADPSGKYWLYYTKNAGANPGAPITDLIFDNIGIVEGASTVMTATSSTGLKADMNDKYFVHCVYDTTLGYIQALYVGHGKTQNAAFEDLLSMGCTQALMLDLNWAAGGERVYIGYSKYIPDISDTGAKYAVRDIVFTVGNAPEKSIEVNGVKYFRAKDTAENGVSLNVGIADCSDIYVYYTAAVSSGADSPITHIAAVSGDGAPYRPNVNWEYLLTNSGVRCNLNDGVLSVSDDGKYVKDCRLYMFACRKSNTPKPEGIIKFGTGTPIKKVGALYTDND